MDLREDLRTGREYLATATALLQRVRAAHPTAGSYEAADLQWWWRSARTTDDLPQLLWFDERGRPAAAAILTDWGERVALDPIVLPDAPPGQVAHVVERGLAHAQAHGIDAVGMEVDQADLALRYLLLGRGFVADDDAGLVETWLRADGRPPISGLADGYRVSSRLESASGPHHMTNAGRNHPDVEARLRQTSLYRADLDLVVHDGDGAVAAYGLFWHDPETRTGLVEPMRTEDEHQRRGLARHVLTAGLDRLAAAGAERIKICFEPGNPASGHLYLDVGFEPDRRTALLSGPTAPAP